MTIQSSIYKLTSKILKSEERMIVKNAMDEIESYPQLEMGNKLDRKIFRNQSARQAFLQFYGYLLADFKKVEIENKFGGTIPSLSSTHREILINICRDMIYLNKKCIKYLPGNLIHHEVLNSYTGYEHIFQLSRDYTPVYLDNTIIEKISLAFKKHGGLTSIGKISVKEYKELNKIDVDKLAFIVKDFEDRIIKSGVNHYPRDLEKLIEDYRKRSALTPIRYIFSLICLKASLNNINQIIYQAFLAESLPLYNEENIINYSKHSHFVGEGYNLKALPNGNSGSVADLVHLLSTEVESPILGRIESLNHSSSIDFGSSIDLSMRVLDHDMNQYAGLLENISRK